MTYPNKTHYSEHFTRRELDCHCGCDAPPAVEANLAKLALSLESLRTRLGGVPLHINSGYRCPSYNARIGGAKQSQHMSGKAADLSGRSVSPAKIAQHAEMIPGFKHGGIGRYKHFTHVDIRDGAARWNG
jgi:uncharacterized protein YcbK (DUF882 family)